MQDFDTSIRLATIRQGELLRSATRQRRIRFARLAHHRTGRHTTTEGA
ncbi:MAG TPA: hypothetical protein VFH02_10580 [Jiangellaceae bacterium]|nr:hypothetical protein [Jiangellaceae bacterium]